MSIKDLFSRKTVVVKNAESASVDAESNRFVLRKAEENETFIPPVDFSTASNFIRFGSAEEYYEASVRRVYSEYPYDGSEAEKILYNLSSSYFDRYILENLYPRTSGYAILNPKGYGGSSLVNGYGLNASSGDYEYIFVGGGVRPSPQKQNDPDADDLNIPLHKKFTYGTFFEEGTDKTSVFQFSAVSGSTFEFWMKKNSFDTSKTQKEVILDLWNGQPTSSALYGRITLELDATNEGGAGANPFRFTYQNGRVGVFRQSLISGSFTTSDVADGKWHHWAVSTKTRIDNTTNYLDLKLYKDGIVINKQSIATTSSVGSSTNIGNISGRLDGYIGALIAPPSSSNGATSGAKYAGKLSASLDEVRFWKKRVSSHEIYNNWFHPIGGGANTDKHRETLALYYKFNEGITLTSSIDSTVLDYSGRVANGKWTGYSAASRNTGSCFVSASVLAQEPLDPIIRSNHNSVKTLISNLKVSGSNYDLNNPSFMYDMVPFWMREEDFEFGDNNLKKIYQILASYFDTLYLQIEALPDIKSKRYFTMDKKPYPFAKQLLEHNGLIVPDLFISQGVLEKFSQRDDQNKKFENDIEDLKKRIYYNIYNNLKTVYESKGTEKAYRNMLRCFGIDDEIVKLNLYTDYGIQYLTDKTKYSSQKTKFLNHNRTRNFTGRVFNTSSVSNPRTFIFSSGPGSERLEKSLAFTLETDVIVPVKVKVGQLDYFPTDFLTSSIMGFHSASADNPHNFSWYGSDVSNLQVHLVRPVNESEDAKFVITNNAKTIFAESETFKKIYSNERWALGLRVYPKGYPFIGLVTTSSNPTYVAELYGVSHVLDEVKREFTISTDIPYAQGSAMLSNTKRFYAGCEATNFTGSAYHYSDLKIAACRLWYDKLEDSALKQHNLDASNYGSTKIHGNPTPYVQGLNNVHIPSAEALAFNWDFQQVTGSDSKGRFVVEDFSSGTSAKRYGWIDDLILRENRAGGFGYEASSKQIVDNEFIFSSKKELPEISFTSDGVFVKGDEEKYFAEDEDTTDNVFAFEKSMYQVVSEEILKTFSTVTEYANLFMKPVDLYREEYKRLDHFKELYFERVQSDFDFEKFTNYYKFIDSTISVFIQQLHPAMAKFNEGISDIIESHILERPKYKRQFPFLVTRDTIPDGKMAGVRERIYNWKEGHAPNYRKQFDENDHCFWQKERASKPAGTILPSGAKLEELRKVIVSEVDGKSKNLGTSDRAIYQGSTYAVRSFSRQYRLTYEEQKTIHGGTNYGHQKNRDFVLDHLKPHGAVGSNSVPQEVITVGVGKGLGVLGLDKCKTFSDPYDTDDYSAKHTEKAEYRFVGTVGRYADATGDQPKSDSVDELFKVKGHRAFPFNLVSGTISTGYNSKISGSYDDDFILTNLHSDTTTPSNDVPMQGPFAEAWVGGRQFRHVPLNKGGGRVSTATIRVGNVLNDQTVTISDGFVTKVFVFKTSADVSNHLEVAIGPAPSFEAKFAQTAISLAAKITHADNGLQISVERDGRTLTLTNTRDPLAVDRHLYNVPIIGNPNLDITGFSGGSTLDTQYTRPEGYRILVGDHPSEPIQDGALGMVGPDYGGPYPDTTRKMAVHYREERAKRPFNIKNIQYSTSSAILGNFKENYEVVHSVGRSTNNRKFVEFSNVSSSLTSPIGNILPQTTNQASLFGGVPLLSGNVFGGTSNITADKARVERYARQAVKASGSLFYDEGQYFYGGLRASGSFKISGSTMLAFDTGGFVVSGAARPGRQAEGSVTIAYPTYTVSEGQIVFTGSTIHGAKAQGSVTPGAMPVLSTSEGSIAINQATIFGTPAVGSVSFGGSMPTYSLSTGSFELGPSTNFGEPAVGSISFGAMPTYSTSTGGAVEINGAYIAPTTAENGAFTVGSKTIYATQYTGSFDLQSVPQAGQRAYVSFIAKTPLALEDGSTLTLDLDGVSKIIETDTDGAVSSSPDLGYETYRRALRATAFGPSLVDTGAGGFTGMPSNFGFSFWINNGDTGTFNSGFIFFYDGTDEVVRLDLDDDLRLRVSSDTTSQTTTYNTNLQSVYGGQWTHVMISLPYDRMFSGAPPPTGYFNPELWINGVKQTPSINNFGSTLAGSQRSIDRLQIRPDDRIAIQDFVVWDLDGQPAFNTSHVNEVYNGGTWTDPSSNAVTNRHDIVNYYKFGDEDYLRPHYVVGDTLEDDTYLRGANGKYYLSSSYSGAGHSNTNTLSISLSYDEDLTFVKGHGTLTDTEIFNRLKGNIDGAYSGWTTSYRDLGTTPASAQFFVHRDTIGAAPASQSETGGTFTLKSSQNGITETVSTLKHGDNITIEGDTFTINTTTKELYDTKTVNGGQTFRKALHFGGATGIYTTDSVALKNTSYDINWDSTWLSISGWAKYPGNTAANKVLIHINPAATGEQLQLRVADDDWYLYHDTGAQTDTYFVTNQFTGIEAGEWFSFVWVIPKNASKYSPRFYLNGALMTISGLDPDNEQFDNTTSAGLYIGANNGNLYGWGQSVQDVAIWEAELDGEDANVLFNSGSWFDISQHSKAQHVSGWWLLGKDTSGTGATVNSLASGSALSAGGGVGKISPEIGSHDLEMSDNTKIYVSDGIMQTAHTDSTIFNDLKNKIVAETLYEANNIGYSTVSFSTSGNTGTFTLTDNLSLAPTAFSTTSGGGFKNLSGPTSNGDSEQRTGGANEGDYVDIGGVRFSPDTNGNISTKSSPFYAVDGSGNYHVYSNAADDATWWTRFAAAVNAGVTTHTTTVNTSTGVYDVDADAAGSAGNKAISVNGSTFSNPANVAGGTDAQNTANHRVIKVNHPTASADSQLRVAVTTDLRAVIDDTTDGLIDNWQFVQDGVWRNTQNTHRNFFYVSSTGSAPGSSGVTAAFWQRITASLAAGIQEISGHPGSYSITDLGSGRARIGFTGSFTISDGHDFDFGAVNLVGSPGPVSSGDTFVYSHSDSSGFGTPDATFIGSNISVNGVVFEFVHPYNNYAKADATSIPIRPTGSKASLLTTLNATMSANVPNFNFGIQGDLIGMTSSIGGTVFNNKIVLGGNYFPVDGITQTNGGFDETGAGHNKYLDITYQGGTTKRYYAMQTLASGSGTLMGTNGGILVDGNNYYISTSGSTGDKTDGIDADYWDRWLEALRHGTNAATGQQGTWARRTYGSEPTTTHITFTGSYGVTNAHTTTAIQPNNTGPGGVVVANVFGNFDGFGIPSPSGHLGRFVRIDGTTFEFVHPFNNYAKTDGNNIPIRPTGSRADLLTTLNATMSANVPNFNFAIEGNLIGLTGSVTGSARNNNISFSAGGGPLFNSFTQTAGGTDEDGVGHGKFFQLKRSDGTSGSRMLVTVQTLASGSGNLMGANGGILKLGNIYYISSTGSTGNKTNGINSDYWTRWKEALEDATNSLTGQSGTWTVTSYGDSSVLSFVGSYQSSSVHDLYYQLGANSDKVGEPLVLGSTASSGFGFPPASYRTGGGNVMQIDGINFENVYPYNNYAKMDPSSTNVAIFHAGKQANYVAKLNASMSANLTDYENFSVSGDQISFTAKTFGSVHNETLSNLFHTMTTTNIVGGANQLGVSNGSYITLNTPAGTLGRIFASTDLRATIDSGGTYNFIENGVWKQTTSPVQYHISSTGSNPGDNGVPTEWVRRVSNTLERVIREETGAPLNSFEIISGSAPTYRYTMNITGSLTASNAQDVSFGSIGDIRHSSISATGFGKLIKAGVATTDVQMIRFLNGADPDRTYQFTVPHDNYALGAGNIGIRATGSVTSFFNRVSASFLTSPNHTIKRTETVADGRKFTFIAGQVGPSFNSDINVPAGSTLVKQVLPMSGGYSAYNQFDDNHILLSHISSKNHLFILDHDGAQPAITPANYTFPASVGGGKFKLSGQLVPFSNYSSTLNTQPDIVLVRGSTYKFFQTDASNAAGGGHPIVFHTSPVTSSGAGTEIQQLNRVPGVTYFNDGVETTYGSYVPSGHALDFVRIAVDFTTPRRLFYGCGNHANMGGAIYVIDASELTYVDTTGTDIDVWNRLSSSMNAEFPRHSFTYSDPFAPDQSETGTPTSTDYIPSIPRALFMITGSTNTGSIDQMIISATGSSWSNIQQVTGAMTYAGQGVGPGAALNFSWGKHPDSGKRRIKSIGFGGLAGEDPFRGFVPTSGRTQNLFTSIFTGSNLPPTVNVNSQYYLSSSALWTQVSSSIMSTGQYTITSIVNSPDNRWTQFNVAAKYYDTRFNFTGSDNTAHPEEWTTRTGMTVTSASVQGNGATGITVVNNILGGVNPTAQDANGRGNVAQQTSFIEFQLGDGQVVRIRSNTDGWRDRQGDPVNTIYWTPRTDLLFGAATIDIRAKLSGALSSLRINNAPHQPPVYVFPSPIRPYPHHIGLTASVGHAKYNFLTEARIVGTGFYSGSTTEDVNGNYIASHFITGGVTPLKTVYYSSRTNINQREQALLEDGDRNKTIITSRFYGGGGPEVMTEAFLDVYAKEKSVYSALPFRNLLIKNDSGEDARQIKFIDHYNVAITESMGATIRVNSHTNRREGLNTLHSRHSGRAGVDSKHGNVGQSDYDMSNGNYEPSYHKVPRNTRVVPRLVADSDTAVVLVEKKNNFYLQTHIPASDYHYSWATSSLGDNYSVRSGRQKVFGYWPKDGILIRNNKKGERGSYYDTQITASTFESAIVFPTGSEVHGS